jgi:hypothetical protein
MCQSCCKMSGYIIRGSRSRKPAKEGFRVTIFIVKIYLFTAEVNF